jgi:hypothetical protein
MATYVVTGVENGCAKLICVDSTYEDRIGWKGFIEVKGLIKTQFPMQNFEIKNEKEIQTPAAARLNRNCNT